ncbi:MAG: MOSC domain-containing protein, partial [Hyphomicrobiaceae bacterium]
MLTPTDIFGTVIALLVNGDREASLQSQTVERVDVTYEGFAGEAHGGLTRPSCSRVLRQYPTRGTEIRNARQVTILADDELQQMANALDIPKLPPEWIGANLVLAGVPKLTQLPPSSRLIFENGTSIVVDMENGPCKYPAEIIESHHPGKGLAFPKVARGLRGVVAWIERTGEIAIGDTARLHIPPQRLYAV